jgi:hypothetical protein
LYSIFFDSGMMLPLHPASTAAATQENGRPWANGSLSVSFLVRGRCRLRASQGAGARETLGQGRHRQADAAAHQAHLLRGPFDRNRVGLVKQVAMQPSRRKFASRAVARSPAMAAAHIWCIRAGATLAVTEMDPLPPSSIKAMAVASSPLYTLKPAGARFSKSEPRSILAGGILDADDARYLGQSQRRFVRQVGDGAPGTL